MGSLRRWLEMRGLPELLVELHILVIRIYLGKELSIKRVGWLLDIPVVEQRINSIWRP